MVQCREFGVATIRRLRARCLSLSNTLSSSIFCFIRFIRDVSFYRPLNVLFVYSFVIVATKYNKNNLSILANLSILPTIFFLADRKNCLSLDNSTDFSKDSNLKLMMKQKLISLRKSRQMEKKKNTERNSSFKEQLK